MVPHWLSNLASIGMAVGPPLVYADQTVSIIKKKYVSICYIMTYPPSSGHILETQLVFLGIYVQFCAYIILIWSCLPNSITRLVANITRCFFWLGEHFEFTLLMQSILMILCQVSFPHMSPKGSDLS